MKVTLNYRKSALENASELFGKAKELKAKAAGAREALIQTEKEIAQIEKERTKEAAKPREITLRVKREKKWFEKFRYFTASNGSLCIGGKDATQNEQLVSKYFEDEDLFFHADIQGGSVVIMKNGVTALTDDSSGTGAHALSEAAQFAASYSNAWKNGNANVDVYCVKRSQVAKHAHGGFLPKGGFAIEGERTWFRGTTLGIEIGMVDDVACAFPERLKEKPEKKVGIIPGAKERGDAAREISKQLGCHLDDILALLPPGSVKIQR